MTHWIDIAPEGSLAEGEHVVVDLDDGTEVAVFRVQGQYYAVEDACTHDGNPIAGGGIFGTEIVCPRHAARFCLKTGRALCPPAYEDIAIFETRVQDGRIQVRNRA